MTLPPLLPLHWLRPWWLGALLALPLLAWWWRRRHRARSAWQGLVDAHLLPVLLASPGGRRAQVAPWLPMLAGALAIVALAGPSWQRAPQPLWQQRAPLVVALDLSSASLAGDLPPSRLAQARAKLAQLLHARAGGQVGLVAYADDAFTVAPLTDDAANVALLLDALAPDVMPADGSDAARAIAWSARLLQQAGYPQGDILLLSDHADAGARGAARQAARAGYRVSAIGLGTPQGAAYRRPDGTIGRAALDTSSLQALAAAGEGGYATLAAGSGDLAALRLLDPRRAGGMAAPGERTLLWRDQGYWLLLPALLFAALAFRRGGMPVALLLCALLPWAPAQAADGWWRRPDQQAHARLDAGAQAYQRGDYAEALRAWQGLPGADAAYNRGNALAKAGDYRAAIAAYDRALALQPGMPDAIANRDAVRRALQQQRRQGGSQPGKQPQQQPGGRQQDQGQAGSPRQSQPRSAQQPGGPPQATQAQPGEPARESEQDKASPSPGETARSAPSPPADANAQRQADAAQRERMRQALQRQRATAATERAAAPAETPAERERRLANEAWLRRIPDDPGGLLRAKFRLEAERRREEGR